MDKQFKAILRTGAKLDMFAEIEALQEEYYNDLQASVDSFDSYYEVSLETENDLRCASKVINTFCRLGYLFPEEANAMIECLADQRKTVLEKLEGGNE